MPTSTRLREFDPRLAAVVPPVLEPPRSLLGKILERSTEPPDRWWEQSADQAAMATTLREPLALALTHAQVWFEQHGTEEACRQAHERVQARLSSRPQSTAG